MIEETVIDTRKKDKNVVIISEEWYGEMEKAERNSVICGSWIAVLLRLVPGMVS